MKNISPSAHKNIFLLVCMCLAVLLIIAVVSAGRDEAMHRDLYRQYEAANRLFEERQFGEPYAIYKRLSELYSDSYILELKMAVCAMNMEMWDEAVGHSRRTIELYPMLSKDMDFMEAFIYCLKELGEHEAANSVEEYFYGFASMQG